MDHPEELVRRRYDSKEVFSSYFLHFLKLCSRLYLLQDKQMHGVVVTFQCGMKNEFWNLQN